jgi:hypothetical protein
VLSIEEIRKMFIEPMIYAILVEEPFRKHWSRKWKWGENGIATL